ncbi:porin family protein [Sulfitobacter sp. SK012]|uniref:porin family protein n=1 Tax=Sulfitobacter sp. SK012 TaxID=1389005 RepID=UPI0013B3CB29|nr:porin family protein [Sulfitobacter sp. SK012]
MAGFIAMPLAHAQAESTRRVAPQEIEKAAFISLQERDPARALFYAEALAERDPDDLTPQLLMARALRDLGRYKEAQKAARRAWSLAEDGSQKFSSALIMAQTLSSDNKRTRAQLWLRRAVHHAPTEQLAARAKRDFKYVQQRNPWQTYLSFTLAPNSNINNGSVRDSSRLNYAISDIVFGGPIEYTLSGASQALSGLEIGGDVKARYRFSQTSRTAHDVNFSMAYRTFVLSSSAKDILREAKEESGSTDDLPTGSDFAYGRVSIGYRYSRLNYNGKGELIARAELGQSWYGGASYTAFFRGGLSQSYRPSRAHKFTLALNTEVQDGYRTYDSHKSLVTGSIGKLLESGSSIYGAASFGAQTSNYKDAEYGEFALRAGYVMRKPVMGAGLFFGLGTSYRDYEVSQHDASGRNDLRVTADVTAVFRQIDYYGFNPSLTLKYERTESNIGLYDTRRLGMSVGIRSSF